MGQREQRKRKVSSRLTGLDNAAVNDARERWLDTLEDDQAQANEEAELLNDADDAAYPGSEVDEIAGSSTAVMARKPPAKKKRLRTSVRQSSVDDYDEQHGEGGTKGKQRLEQWNMSLVRMLQEEQGVQRPKMMPSLSDIEAKPSVCPPRRFCIVCGFAAPYTCSKCASRFCSLQCAGVHEQTQCLKMMAAV